tara:strand:- start:5353 stop:5745 length:393 start_codon:yes stop_codon:yes gene_type:complete
MEIKDKEGNLLALILNSNEIDSEKYFATENSQELQVGIFNLEKDAVIERHIHSEQAREIKTTSEVVLVTEGELIVDIYSKDLELLHTSSLFKGDVLAMFQGGHGLKMGSKCKFIEVKQGPYIEEIDKKTF